MSDEENSERGDYSIEELAVAAGVPVRTVRFYITEGLLSGPGTRGKAATYRVEHLARMRLIRLLVRQRLPLVEIRDMLAGLSNAEVNDLLAREEQRTASLEQSAQATSPKAYIAALLENARAARGKPSSVTEPPFRFGAPSPYGKPSPAQVHGPRPSPPTREEPWYRVELAPGVELHMSAVARRRYATLIERLRELAERERSP